MSVDIPNALSSLPSSSLRHIGRAQRRVEDPALLTGRTCFIDDVVLPRMLHCAILRSPFAHARVTAVDTREAAALPGAAVSRMAASRYRFQPVTALGLAAAWADQ